ncbi:MAG: aminotransferase class III-fold pyridoxal phosphate-dependent enzyme, partial [Solirubrobacterales bacterium]|nr:aminotransferase class III-fold pyridoxal phosphate-dependent enzyme [Solirubrobacterales bacterium]
LLPRGEELEGPLYEQMLRVADSPNVAEVRGGLGFLAAVEIAGEILEADPGAPIKLGMAAREQGVLMRPLGRGVAVSPPLTATEEHLQMIGDAIEKSVATLG